MLLLRVSCAVLRSHLLTGLALAVFVAASLGYAGARPVAYWAALGLVCSELGSSLLALRTHSTQGRQTDYLADRACVVGEVVALLLLVLLRVVQPNPSQVTLVVCLSAGWITTLSLSRKQEDVPPDA